VNAAEIVIYRGDETAELQLEVRVEEDTVWLNRQQMAELFSRDVKTIGKHINNALKEELKSMPVIAKFATTASDGKTYQVEHYSLDMILSVGYRVKSQRGVQFRRWANEILKEFLLKGYAIQPRVERIEKKLLEHDQKFDLLIHSNIQPAEGIFYDGQVFDAWEFVSGIIKSAKKSIVLIDNYIDETVLALLTKRQAEVSAKIFTANISRSLELDLERHNKQYPAIELYFYKSS
jgi:hypothetical protein